MELSPQKKKWLIIIGAILALLVITTLLSWNKIKTARALNLAADANTLIENEEYGPGWEAAKAAYALAPNELEVARTLAGITDQAEPRKAPELWETIYEQSGDEADLLAWFDSTLRLADKNAIAGVADRLKADFPNSAKSLHRQAQSAMLQGKPAVAVGLARAAAMTKGAEADIQFAYVQLSQRSQDAVVREAGIEWLRNMAQLPDETGLKASRWLLTAPNLSRDQLLLAATQLSKHPLATREDLLTEIVLRRYEGQQSMEDLLAEVKALFTLDDPAELVELGRWLNQNNRPADFLRIVDQELALSRRDLFLVWVDAMAMDQQWDKIEPLMDRPSLPLDPFTRILFRARIQQELGNEHRRDLIWGQALLAANDDINKLQFAYDYAMKLQWNDQAREVLERLAQIPRSQRIAYEKLVELDQVTGDIESLYSALLRMSEEYPDDPDVANDLAYVNLLMGKEIEQSALTAKRLLDESDRPYLANIITLALAQYQAGNHQAALDQLYPLAIDWNEARPSFRAIYAAILAANGHNRESQSIMEGVNLADLLPEERKILQQARLQAE